MLKAAVASAKALPRSLCTRTQSARMILSSRTLSTANGSNGDLVKSNEPTNGSQATKWTVVPQNRFRNSVTHRLWVKRYMDQDPPGAIKIGTDGTVSPASDAPVDMQRPLIPKRMKDSYVEEFLPFKSEPQVKEEYVNVYGGIRIGKILEDLDALSGSVAYSHCDDHEPYTPPMRIVTASVDRIDLLSPIPPDVDVRLSGYVSYVGSSSMEVSLSMETVPGGIVPTEDGFTMINPEEKGVPILAAKFTMVARDPYTNKATKVNPLRLETDEERKIFRLGAEHKARKQVAAQTSLSKTPPSVEEMFLVHDLYLNSMKYMDREYAEPKPNDVIWMTDTAKESFTLCMPQDRNIHNFIFGGYLMRLAYELAYVDALAFSKSRPYFIALDDIIFRKPVPIGSVLHLKAQIVYSSNLSEPSKNANTFQVSVRATVEDPLTGTREHTNTFHFTFATKAECAQVLPRSYDESMQFIEGKRRKEVAMEHLKYNTSAWGTSINR